MTLPPASRPPDSAVIDGVDVDAVASAVLGCAGVAGLDGGRFGEVASYLPDGRQVPGVVISDGRVLVHIRARWGVQMPYLVVLIRAVLMPLTGPRPVDVTIADIDDPPGTPGPQPSAGTFDGPGQPQVR